MSQQKMFATTNPMAVAAAASMPREAYHGSAPVKATDGSPRSLTAQSSAVRHFRQVAAKR